MRVLFLGREGSPTLAHLIEIGEDVDFTADPIDPGVVQRARPQFLVSHGYRHIIKPDVLALVPDRAINLHIAYLTWNRGADQTCGGGSMTRRRSDDSLHRRKRRHR